MQTKKTLRGSCTSSRLLMIAGLLLGLSGVCLAQDETFYTTPPITSTDAGGAWRDNYNGASGCRFTVGSTNVVVSHLGYFSTNNFTGLATNHYVGIFDATGTNVLAQVVVPAGRSALYTNDFYWVQLDPPLLLRSNTTYFVAAQPYNGDGDWWGDSFTAAWNGAFVGTTTNTINAPATAYGPAPGGNFPGWPPPGGFSTFGSNTTYCVEGMGYIGVGQARVGVQTTNVLLTAGARLLVNGFASGQPPISYQWWQTPNTPVINQTNAILDIPNATTANNGTYYLTASNSLGGEQSANVTVTVTALPVGISQQPTNTTAFANYPATFTCVATGSPPISLQWSLNGNAISGATGTNYTLAVATLADDGDIYSCLASNYIAPTPHTAQSQNALLTVLPNLALPPEFLHGDVSGLNNNTYQGQQGGLFTVGNSPVLVTHLGYYAWPANRVTNGTSVTITYSTDHHVGIYLAPASIGAGGYVPTNDLLGSVDVPAGTVPVINGYAWEPLNPPLVLSNNTRYLLVAETKSDADWGDTYHVQDLNPHFATGVSAVYSGGAWGTSVYLGGEYGGQIYSAPNMAVLALPTPSAYVAPTSQSAYAGLDAMFTATVDGQAPVAVQWYKEPGTPLNGQTNQTLILTNLSTGESGNYYVVATNYQTGASAPSADVSLTVLADAPSITNDIQAQAVLEHQTVQFTVGAQGAPPLRYVWTLNGIPIPGATNSTLTINDVTTSDVGNYQVIVTNFYGQAPSSSVGLAVTIPAWGTYPSAVMGADLMLFYPLNENNVNSGVATNWGSLGFGDNGSYQSLTSGNTSVPGPTNILNYPATASNVVSLDGYDGYAQVPPLAGVVVSNLTIAAWVNDTYPNSASGYGQVPNAAIFFQRSTYVFGLSVNPVASTNQADQLRGTWGTGSANQYFDSELVLPTNQWALAALVITPTNRAFYLNYGNGLLSTNFAATDAPVTFGGNSYIGWDTAGGTGGRLWQGPIGDVMIFDQAFSPQEINALYLGVPPTATLTIARAGANLTVTWPGGTLLEATNILGPWTPTANATNGVYNFTPSVATKFYRVQLQP